MGLYGSPELLPQDSIPEEKRNETQSKHRPYQDGWVYATMVVMDIIWYISSGLHGTAYICSLLMMNGFTVLGLSVISLISSLNNKQEVGPDIKAIGFSVVALIAIPFLEGIFIGIFTAVQ